MRNIIRILAPVLMIMVLAVTIRVITRPAVEPPSPKEASEETEENTEKEPEATESSQPETPSEPAETQEEDSSEDPEEEAPAGGPIITFAAARVELEAGRVFDPAGNIASVTDEEGNELSQAETLTNGTYVIEMPDNIYNEGTYKILVHAMDQEGAKATKSYDLKVFYYQMPEVQEAVSWYIRVNRALNTVTVYERNEDGTYGEPFRVMECSSGGLKTPLGTFSTTDQYEWRPLVNHVYGQYCTRITGQILFHSVPYYTEDPSDLESEEFNKLGNDASQGCIRLRVCDAKWIYDNCPAGTVVEIYDDTETPGPLGKPDSVTIDLSSEYSGWDPTDPKHPLNSEE